jgi:hypothetical protein
MKTSLIPACLAGLLVLSAACSDDERDPPPFRSGVDASEDTRVSELTTEQKSQICDQYGQHVDAYLDINQVARAVCLPTSLIFGFGSEESCEDFLNDCVRDFPVTGQVSAQLANRTQCIASLDTCDTSVVQLEGCVNFNLDLVYDILNRLSCRRANDSSVMNEAVADQQAASVCAQRDNTCGAIVDSPIL